MSKGRIVTKASDLFLETLRARGGHAVHDCPHGLTWFDGSNDGLWDWERGELEELNRKARFDSTKYKSVDGGPSSVRYAGTVWILDCDLCLEGIGKWERFLWNNREQIGEFMAAKARELAEDADSARIVAGAVDKLK